MPEVTNGEVVQTLKRLEEMIEKGARTPAGHSGPGRSWLGGHQPATQFYGGSNRDDWPVEQLKSLQCYDMAQAEQFIKSCGGQQRLLGWGPMMIKAGALMQAKGSGRFPGERDGEHDYRLAAKHLPGWHDGYNEESFEKEYRITPRGATSSHGPCSVAKAAHMGRAPWHSQVAKTSMQETAGATGGFLLPPQYQSELLTIQGEEAFIEPRARVQPMTAREMQWPSLDITTVQALGTNPYFGGILGTWQPETQLFNETEPAFRMTNWTAWDLVLYAVSSNQLLADNGIGLDALMTMLFGQAMVWYSEYAYLRGLGAGATMPLGVINAPCAIQQQRVAPGHFRYADALAMLSHTQIRSWKTAAWVMHQSLLPELGAMVDNTSRNQLVWVSPMGTPGSVGPAGMALPTVFLNNLPIFFTDKLPTLGTLGDVMLVDFSHYIIGKRMDTQIDISPHYLFRNNQLAWRVIFRADAKFWLNSFITDAEGWQISPAIVLK